MNTQLIRKFALPVVFFMASAALFVLVWKPLDNEIRALEADRDLYSGKAGKLVDESRILGVENNVDSLHVLIREMKDRLYPLNEFAALGHAIEKSGKTFGLDLVMITPAYDALLKIQQSGEEIMELPLVISLKGKFHQFGRFIETLSEFPYVKAKEVTINKNPEEKGIIFAEVRGVVLFKRTDTVDDMPKTIKNNNNI